MLCTTGRVEFTSFLPENTQAAIIQPIGHDGVLIAASNTQRGFTRLDQVNHSLRFQVYYMSKAVWLCGPGCYPECYRQFPINLRFMLQCLS